MFGQPATAMKVMVPLRGSLADQPGEGRGRKGRVGSNKWQYGNG